MQLVLQRLNLCLLPLDLLVSVGDNVFLLPERSTSLLFLDLQPSCSLLRLLALSLERLKPPRSLVEALLRPVQLLLEHIKALADSVFPLEDSVFLTHQVLSLHLEIYLLLDLYFHLGLVLSHLPVSQRRLLGQRLDLHGHLCNLAL